MFSLKNILSMHIHYWFVPKTRMSPKHLVTAHFQIINFPFSIWWGWLSWRSVLHAQCYESSNCNWCYQMSWKQFPSCTPFTILSCTCACMQLKAGCEPVMEEMMSSWKNSFRFTFMLKGNVLLVLGNLTDEKCEFLLIQYL